eukprot:scaffold1127_cov133-Skeletonema_marinoi.AAC.2
MSPSSEWTSEGRIENQSSTIVPGWGVGNKYLASLSQARDYPFLLQLESRFRHLDRKKLSGFLRFA